MPYSILIPIYNEERTLKRLLKSLKEYSKEGNEVIIINDGSDDNTKAILNRHKYVHCINLKKNYGKGAAIKAGLINSKYNKTIIYDGDLELKIQDIKKLMILNSDIGISSAFGFRFKFLNPLKSRSDWGNFIFTTFFNLLFKSCYKDILCCAKSFYKTNIQIKNIRSNKFDIDVELLGMLTISRRSLNVRQIPINYSRRTIHEGKKLKISDGWIILGRILKMLKFL